MRADEGWELVVPHVRRAIDTTYGGNDQRAATAAGVDFRTIQKLLAGKPVRRRPALVRLAEAFGWPPDGFDIARAGGDPEPLGATEEVDLGERVSRLEGQMAEVLEIVRALPGTEPDDDGAGR